MSTCYPEPGSIKIANGEILTFGVDYSNKKSHTGVLGLFYILVAEPSMKLNDPVQVRFLPVIYSPFLQEIYLIIVAMSNVSSY